MTSCEKGAGVCVLLLERLGETLHENTHAQPTSRLSFQQSSSQATQHHPIITPPSNTQRRSKRSGSWQGEMGVFVRH